MDQMIQALARELGRTEEHVRNVVTLIDEGATIPFIARYRKELHGSMDDQLLRQLADRLQYLRSLDARKSEVKTSIENQGKLTEELSAAIDSAATLAEVEDLYPFELSGGMARRVLIATATAESPRLIVADEPTPGLDAKAARQVLGRFRELAEEGAGVLLITHDLELARAGAHKVAVFHEGRTVEEVPARCFQTGQGLAHPYSQALWRAMPRNGFEA